MRNALSLYLILLLVIAGCAGIPTPETYNEKLAAGYQSVTAVRDAALGLLAAKRLTADDAQNVQQQADHARAALDISRKMRATDPAASDAKLQAAIVGLTALQAYLASRRAQ